MKAANQWITYRTRFLVQAKQLSTNLTFTDALGRQHSGCKGDYLVESSDGSFRIAPRQIFEDIYVPLLLNESQENIRSQPAESGWPNQSLERTRASHLKTPVHSTEQRGPSQIQVSPHFLRKGPHSYADRGNVGSA